MKIIDISMQIKPDMMVYKNKPEKKPLLKVTRDIADKHNSVHESMMDIGLHTGTHVDAPLHMIKGGKTIDQVDFSKLMTPCKVLDLTNLDKQITKQDLIDKDIKEDDFLLFKTKNSNSGIFDFEFVFLEKSGAEFLRDKKIKGVGIDALGIERSQPDHETHLALLSNDVMILEGLRLKHVSEGEYYLMALPLSIKGAEASPVRAVLLDKDFKNKV